MKVKFIDYSKHTYGKDDFLYQCLEENFKDAIRFKTNGWLAIWLQFNTVISLIQLSEQAT
jgi:GntR family transcriptional regulator/MocR family aminotransferase